MSYKALKVHTVNKNYMPKGFKLIKRVDDYNIMLQYNESDDINDLMDYQNIIDVEIIEVIEK